MIIFLTQSSINPRGKKLITTKTRLEWLRVDFIFSREGLTEENGIISLNEYADSLEKVTTVKQVAQAFRDLIILLLLFFLFFLNYFFTPGSIDPRGKKTRS